MKRLGFLTLVALTALVAITSLLSGRATAVPMLQATPPPGGPPYVLTGKLGAYVQVSDGCSYYPLTDCAGMEVHVSEKSAGLLTAFVGQNVRLEVVTAECGTGIAGQPLYGPVATNVKAGVACPTTATPPPVGTPYILTGRLGAYVQVADGCSYYPLTNCAGQETQVSEKSAGLLSAFVGQNVRLEVVTAECGSGIAGQPLYGPVAINVQRAAACPTTATPPPMGTPYVLTGKLGAYVQVADGCSYYPLTNCAGREIQVSERTLGQLTAYVGRDVRLEVVRAECGNGIAGQPLYGPVAINVLAGLPCPATPTPSPIGTPNVLIGKLGKYVQVADGCSYYPLTNCDEQEIQVSEKSPGQLSSFVGQNVRLEVVMAECGSGIAGQPLYGPVANTVRVSLPCQPLSPTPEPTNVVTQTLEHLSLPIVVLNYSFSQEQLVQRTDTGGKATARDAGLIWDNSRVRNQPSDKLNLRKDVWW